jgi:hypothetical protein
MFPCGESLQLFKVRGADWLEQIYELAGHAAKFQTLGWAHIVRQSPERHGCRGFALTHRAVARVQPHGAKTDIGSTNVGQRLGPQRYLLG